MIKNIFFDFDGVIADSVDVKTDAFAKLYEQYGKTIMQKVVEHHKANGGMSRFEKFKFYHKKFLDIELNEDEVEELSDQFSSLVKQGVVNAPEVPGSHKFLKKHSGIFNMFVITGTPTNESIEICKERGILHCFRGVYGSPEKKDYWSNYIIKQYNFDPNKTIFVGDALADYNAAMKSNLVFYLREYAENNKLFKDINNIIRFKDFYDFENLILNK